jgi:hypothetical protein
MTPRVNHKMFPGEVRMKEWIIDEAQRTGNKIGTIRERVSRRKFYKDRIKVRKVNYSVGFISEVKK